MYQDAKWLEQCLRSLCEPTPKVDSIVVVDGAYEGFPHEQPYSTDGTLELAEQYADVVVRTKHAWKNEIVKRNYYIQFVPDNAWWLRIDADEELVGDFRTFRPEPDQLAGYMRIKRVDMDDSFPVMCLYKKGETSRYYGTHHSVWYEDKLLPKLETNEVPVYQGAMLLHYTNLRSVERRDARGIYHREALQPQEAAFRRTYY